MNLSLERFRSPNFMKSFSYPTISLINKKSFSQHSKILNPLLAGRVRIHTCFARKKASLCAVSPFLSSIDKFVYNQVLF